ncbi:MAG: serine protease [Candidatus Methylacidiphilales bacterium]
MLTKLRPVTQSVWMAVACGCCVMVTSLHLVSQTASAQTAPGKEAAKAPIYSKNFVGTPQFFTTQGESSAGTASIVQGPDGKSTYIITARHLLGPSGGFKSEVAAADVPATVQSIVLTTFDGGTERKFNIKGIAVPVTGPESSVASDLALFLLPNVSPPNYAATLAAKEPSVGDRVWVIARVRGGVPEGQVVHPGRITAVETIGSARILEMQYDNNNIVANGASGSPVLNAAGEVVGICTGQGSEDGHKQAYIFGSKTIRKVIEDPASFK